jgi:group I intron endonuclease
MNTIYSIYKITNLVNSKVYVGWTHRDPSKRFNEHITRNNCPISWSIKKRGADNFLFEVIYQTKDEDHSHEMETYFIKQYNSLIEQWGYNRDLGGTGHKRTSATIEKHREKIKGRKQSAEHIRKRAASVSGDKNGCYGRTGEKHPRYGKTWTEEERQKIRDGIKAANANKPIMTEEEKRLARIEYSRRYRERHKQ